MIEKGTSASIWKLSTAPNKCKVVYIHLHLPIHLCSNTMDNFLNSENTTPFASTKVESLYFLFFNRMGQKGTQHIEKIKLAQSITVVWNQHTHPTSSWVGRTSKIVPYPTLMLNCEDILCCGRENIWWKWQCVHDSEEVFKSQCFLWNDYNLLGGKGSDSCRPVFTPQAWSRLSEDKKKKKNHNKYLERRKNC